MRQLRLWMDIELRPEKRQLWLWMDIDVEYPQMQLLAMTFGAMT